MVSALRKRDMAPALFVDDVVEGARRSRARRVWTRAADRRERARHRRAATVGRAVRERGVLVGGAVGGALASGVLACGARFRFGGPPRTPEPLGPRCPGPQNADRLYA